MTGEPLFIAIEEAIAEIYPTDKAPRVRTVREDMDRRGFIVKKGRACYTTRPYLNAYKKELLSCVDTERSSTPFGAKGRTERFIGRRAASYPSAERMVLSPDDELKSALEATQRLRAKRKSIDSMNSTRNGH
jgi:hypothetical protein